MAIDFKPFEELFAPESQLTYISMYGGYIDVGPNTYSVFHNYTMTERQVIFQVCEKYLPWEYTQEQEQWERTIYMYQFVIKSPPPFPYEQYTLSEEIIKMSIAWYIVPYQIKREPGNTYRRVALCDFHEQIVADGAQWAETEVLGNRAIVKVKASDAIIAVLDARYKRLPKDILDDSLSDLPVAAKIAIKNEILDMGYTIEEIQERFGNDLSQYTLRDVLKFMARCRLKPRYIPETDTIVCDGIEQECRSIEFVDSEIQ